MSMRFYYYLGTENSDGKMDIFAPYDINGKVHPIAESGEDDNTGYKTLTIDRMSEKFKEIFCDYNMDTHEFISEPLDFLEEDNMYMQYKSVEDYLKIYAEISSHGQLMKHEEIIKNAICIFVGNCPNKKYFVIREWA